MKKLTPQCKLAISPNFSLGNPLFYPSNQGVGGAYFLWRNNYDIIIKYTQILKHKVTNIKRCILQCIKIYLNLNVMSSPYGVFWSYAPTFRIFLYFKSWKCGFLCGMVDQQQLNSLILSQHNCWMKVHNDNHTMVL